MHAIWGVFLVGSSYLCTMFNAPYKNDNMDNLDDKEKKKRKKDGGNEHKPN